LIKGCKDISFLLGIVNYPVASVFCSCMLGVSLLTSTIYQAATFMNLGELVLNGVSGVNGWFVFQQYLWCPN